MFSVSEISNSLISRLLYNSQETSSTEDSDASAQVSDLTASDIVTLSSESMDLLEDLINSTGEGSSSSTQSSASLDLLNSLYNSASDDSASSDASSESQSLLNVLLNSTVDPSDTLGNSLYDALISAQNTRLINNNPDLVNMILTANESDTTDSSSLISSIDDINMVTMSASEILNIIEKYKENSGSTTSSSQTDITV